MLSAGLKSSADAYACKGYFLTASLWYMMNRRASYTISVNASVSPSP
jgi:hypothetical protein